MRKFLLLYCLFVLFYTDLNAQSNGQIKKNNFTLILNWNQLNNTLDTNFIVTYSYNSNFTEVELVEKKLVQNNWLNSKKVIFFRQSFHEGNDSIYYYYWDNNNNNWDISSRTYNLFNSNGEIEQITIYLKNQLSTTSKYYRDFNGHHLAYVSTNHILNWKDSTAFQVDPQGKFMMSEKFNLTFNSWYPSSRYTYQYYADDKLQSIILEEYINGTYNNLISFEYAYELQPYKVIQTFKKWNVSTNNWDFYEKKFSTFNQFDKVDLELTQRYDSSGWANIRRQTFSYDTDGDLTELNYDIIPENRWVNLEKIQYYYIGNTSIKDTKDENLLIFPNPSTGSFTISYPHQEIERIQIYNSFGRLISEVTDKIYFREINLESQSNGTYYIKIQTKKNYFIRKILKQ